MPWPDRKKRRRQRILIHIVWRAFLAQLMATYASIPGAASSRLVKLQQKLIFTPTGCAEGVKQKAKLDSDGQRFCRPLKRQRSGD